MGLREWRSRSRVWILLILPILLAVFVALDPSGLFGVRRYESNAIIRVRLGPHDTWIPQATAMKSWEVFQPALNLPADADGLYRYEVFRDRLFVEPTGNERGELFVRYRSSTPNEAAETLIAILRHYREMRANQTSAEQKAAARMLRATLCEQEIDVALAHDRLLQDLKDTPGAAIDFLKGFQEKVSNPQHAIARGRGELMRLDELLVDGRYESIELQGEWPPGFRRLSSHYHRVDTDRSRRLLDRWLKNMIRDSRELLAVALYAAESSRIMSQDSNRRSQIAGYREAVRNDDTKAKMLSAVRIAYLQETKRSFNADSFGVTVVRAWAKPNRVWLTRRSAFWGLVAGMVTFLGIVGIRRRAAWRFHSRPCQAAFRKLPGRNQLSEPSCRTL